MSRKANNCDHGRRNTLGLSQKDIERLLDRYDAESGGSHAKREFTRWKYRLDRVVIRVTHPGGSVVDVPVICRNLSNGGIGVLHNNYLHSGSNVLVLLEKKGKIQEVPGIVRRCNHREGLVHDIGIQFRERIDVREILGLDILSQNFSRESIDINMLRGSVVHVEPSSLDRRIVQHFLREAGVTLRQAESAAQGLELLNTPADLVIVAHDLGEISITEFVASVREQGSLAPIMVTVPNEQQESVDLAVSLKCEAMLAKPITQDLLFRALAEFLLTPTSTSGLNIEAAGGQDNTLIDRVNSLGQTLNEAIGRNDPNGCFAAVQQLRNAAHNSNLSVVASHAEKAYEDLQSTQSVEACIRILLDLTIACEQAGVSQAA